MYVAGAAPGDSMPAPAWLAHLHDTLDADVFAAYGWAEAGAPGELGEEELLSRLLALNLERAA